MKYLFATEGVSEYQTFSLLYPQFREATSNEFIAPLRVPISPNCSPELIAAKCKTALHVAKAKMADVFVLVIDRESNEACPGGIADAIQERLSRFTDLRTHVVIKDRMFENWLLADLDALGAQPGRFTVDNTLRRRIEPNRADSCDASALIKKACISKAYSKTSDSALIMKRVRIDTASKNSRSFRHLMHVIGHEDYADQCRVPLTV